VTVGCSFDVLHFDCCMAFFPDGLFSVETALQMMQRSRKLHMNEYVICFTGCQTRNLPVDHDTILDYWRYHAETTSHAHMPSIGTLPVQARLSRDGRRILFPHEDSIFFQLFIEGQIIMNKSRNGFAMRMCSFLRGMGGQLVHLQTRLSQVEEKLLKDDEKAAGDAIEHTENQELCDAPLINEDESIRLQQKRMREAITKEEQLALDKYYLCRHYHLPRTFGLTPAFIKTWNGPQERAVFARQRLMVADAPEDLLRYLWQQKVDYLRLGKKFDYDRFYFAACFLREMGFKHWCDSAYWLHVAPGRRNPRWLAQAIHDGTDPTKVSRQDLETRVKKWVNDILSNAEQWDIIRQWAGWRRQGITSTDTVEWKFKKYLDFANGLFLEGLGLAIQAVNKHNTNFVLCNLLNGIIEGTEQPSLYN
jgi:hypothetical protein